MSIIKGFDDFFTQLVRLVEMGYEFEFVPTARRLDCEDGRYSASCHAVYHRSQSGSLHCPIQVMAYELLVDTGWKTSRMAAKALGIPNQIYERLDAAIREYPNHQKKLRRRILLELGLREVEHKKRSTYARKLPITRELQNEQGY